MKYIVLFLMLCWLFCGCETTKSWEEAAGSFLSADDIQIVKTSFMSEKVEVSLTGDYLNPEAVDEASVRIDGRTTVVKWDRRPTMVGDEENQICRKLVKCKMRFYSSEDVDVAIEWPDKDSFAGEDIGAFVIRYRDDVNPHNAEVGQFSVNGVFNGIGFNVSLPGKGIVPETVDYLRVEVGGKIVRPVWNKKVNKGKSRTYVHKDLTARIDWPSQGQKPGEIVITMEKLFGFEKNQGTSRCQGNVDGNQASFELNDMMGEANLSFGATTIEHSGYYMRTMGKNFKIECLKNDNQSNVSNEIERLLWRCQAESDAIKTINIKIGGPFEKPALFVKTATGEYYLGCLLN